MPLASHFRIEDKVYEIADSYAREKISEFEQNPPSNTNNNGNNNNGNYNIGTITASDVTIEGTELTLADTVQDVEFIKSGFEIDASGETIYREVSPYKYVKKSLYNVNTKTTYGSNASYHHAFFSVTPGVTYYVTGSTPSNTNGHPLCAFYDSSNELIEKQGTTVDTIYTNEEVLAPNSASYMVVNKSSSSVVSIVVRRAVPSTGIKTLDRLNISVFDLQSAVTDIQASLDEGSAVLMGTIINSDEIVDGVYNISTGNVYLPTNMVGKYYHAVYTVKENSYYFVSGNSLSNTGSYPMCAFFDDNGNELSEFGMEPNKQYDDLLVKSPMTATKLIVNKSWANVTILVKLGLASSKDEKGVAATRSYNLDMADALIRMHKANPFVFKTFDKGYVTFIFDDLCNDLDSVASLFEQYNFPLVVAAIPDKMTEACTFLQSTRGNFTPGMVKKDIMAQIVTNGGEVMTHNSSPVVTEVNQYEYDFMYEYFCTSKQNLNNAGFFPRGIIRAGGDGAINRSTEIDRWLIGNYEYANMGTLPQYNWDRVTIQQTQSALKAKILEAYNNHTWLKFMCHSYEFGNGDTFTGEADLIELLEYCTSIGIEIVTCAYIFDHFGSTVFQEYISSNS